MTIQVALYNLFVHDSTLVHLLTTYKNAPAVFSTNPVPGDALAPYVVAVGEVVQTPFDTKQCRGRNIIFDVKAYTKATGSADRVNAIAERVRFLLHRKQLSVGGYNWILSDVNGPVVADETDYYARLISLSTKLEEQ